MNSLNKMKKNLSAWFAIPWYFVPFSIYPVLSLLAFNIGQVKVGTGWRSLLISVLFGGLLFLLLNLLLRNAYRAAFLTTLVLVLFFSYGHVYDLLLEKWAKVKLDPYLLTAWL